ncbi:glutamate--cysteine ligase [Curvivirga sp.]|uniref:glutamate--cysteine ligase n=1 Tax=Curvivirga sp. TaxID=2856848 RepID=UPI003B5C0A24
MAVDNKKMVPLESKDQLITTLSKGCKPIEDWRIGTEHEKFIFDAKTHRRLPYEGTPGIRALLEGLQRYDWKPVYEGDHVIALTDDTGASVSLEPGGQFELSGAPLQTIHQTCSETNRHLTQVKEICGEMGAVALGLGFDPQWKREDVSWMPKGRYKIMREYMPKKGTMGLDMMIRTSTVQVNLDFADEADMVRKMRVSFALQPLATALFANSPFKEGKPNGYLSYRSHTWTDTDNDRCGMLDFIFEDGFGFERWVDYMLDVPMYFIYRNGVYNDVSGLSFKDYMAGNLAGWEGKVPTQQDWDDHLTTAFPEVRLKQFIEMRGADGGPWRNICALPAFWVGLLYDGEALNEAEALIKEWSVADIAKMRDDVPMHALNATVNGRKLRDVARDVLKIAKKGLRNRNEANWSGESEEHFLSALEEVVEYGKTHAERLLDQYNGDWNGDLSKLYEEHAY